MLWKRTKVSRQLRAKNFAAHYAKLQETRTLASPQVSAVSHPVNSGACFMFSVSAVEQSSILLKNSEDSEVEYACGSKKGNKTELRRCAGCKNFSYIAAEIVRNHTGPHIGSCASLSNL